MKFKLTVLLFLFFSSSFIVLPAMGQENYTPGYVVLPEGDTLQGKIDFRDWKKNPKQIEFISAEGGEFTYHPTDISAFYADYKSGRLYESHPVKIDKTPHLSNHLTTNPEPHSEEDTLFLSVYLKDKPISLFYYFDEGGKPHFFIQQDKKLHELVNRRYKVIEGNNVFIKNVEKYKGQLTHLLSDCSSQELPPTIKYKEKPLKNLIKSYNRCLNPGEPTFENQKEPIQFEFGVIAGVSATQLNFRGEAYSDLVNTTFDAHSSLSAGINLNVILPYLHNSFSIYNELAYRPIRSMGMSESKNDFYYSFSLDYLRSSHFFRWQQPQKKLQFFGQAGVFIGYLIRENNSRGNIVNNELVPLGRAIKEDFNKLEGGLSAGAGLRYKGFSGELRLEHGNGFSKSIHLAAPTLTFGLYTAYQF